MKKYYCEKGVEYGTLIVVGGYLNLRVMGKRLKRVEGYVRTNY